MSEPALLNVGQAADAIGVNASTVSRYLRKHPELNRGSAARPKVDADELRRHRAENTDAARCGSYAGRLLGEGDGLDAANGSARPTPDQAAAPPSYTASRAARESVLAYRARVDLDEKLGALVSRDEIEEAIEEAGRMLQRELLELAPRLAEEIATKDNPQEIRARLETEFRALLKKYAAALDIRHIPGDLLPIVRRIARIEVEEESCTTSHCDPIVLAFFELDARDLHLSL